MTFAGARFRPTDLEDEEATPVESELFSEPEFTPPEPTKEGDLPSLEWVKANFKTKSGAIRYLHAQGFNTKQIANHLGVLYQHVRNVVTKELKRGPTEVYHQREWQCSHTKDPFVDVIVRTGVRDPSTDKVLYRVCIRCAIGNIPGVTEDSLRKAIPGIVK